MDVKVTSSSLSTSLRTKSSDESLRSDNLVSKLQKTVSQEAAVTNIRALYTATVRTLKSDTQIHTGGASEAKRLSKDIAGELNSPYSRDEEKELQVEAAAGSLDPKRAATLLEE